MITKQIMQKSCYSCIHWKIDQPTGAILWEGSPLTNEDFAACDIDHIERQWPNAQAVIDAGFVSPQLKAQVAAAQCPQFNLLPQPQA